MNSKQNLKDLDNGQLKFMRANSSFLNINPQFFIETESSPEIKNPIHIKPISFNFEYKNDEIDEVISLPSSSDEDESTLKMPKIPFKFLIIDCSPINFIDTVGVKTLEQVIMIKILKYYQYIN